VPCGQEQLRRLGSDTDHLYVDVGLDDFRDGALQRARQLAEKDPNREH
jgi:hypothetical protein